MSFTVTHNVHVERAPNGAVLQLRHLQQPYLSHSLSGRSLAARYVQEVAETYQLPSDALAVLDSPFHPTNSFTSEPARLRFAGERRLPGTNTLTYVQTVGGLPVWEGGLSVTIQAGPDRVTSSLCTFHYDARIEPSKRDFRPYHELELKSLLQFGPRRRIIEVTSQRRLIYRYETAQQIDPEATAILAPLQIPNPTLPLPPLPNTLADGMHYVVVEVMFTTSRAGRPLHWRAFIEEQTGSVLYLRALVACMHGNVFHIDPVSDTGNGALTGCSGPAMLDPVRTTISLPVIPSSPQLLASEFVCLSDFASPAGDPPTSPPADFTALPSDSIDFGAVNAFYHVDRFFRLMSELGIDPRIYFSSTRFPMPVDHLDTTVVMRDGRPTGPGPVGGYSYGNPSGEGCERMGLAFTAMACASPVLAGCDQRLVFHECSHVILWEKTHYGRMRFCHSTGDSLAIIYADPQSTAPDRFQSFPFIPLANRRHDRNVVAGWAWGGPKDKGERDYNAEQILATTQFRLYRSAGGDDDRRSVQTYASRYILYLIIGAVGLLPPAEIAPTLTVDAWVTALMNADMGTASFEGVPGGTVHKLIRWAFEKQGLYQPHGAPPPPNVACAGAPPDVDVYIDDGRGGEYPYIQSFCNNEDIWNRNLSDGGTMHDTPVVGVPNYVYVRVKNRGTQTANNVKVSGYQGDPRSGLVWPRDWTPMNTPALLASPIGSGRSAVVGPFVWIPRFPGHECILMVASADGDLANTDPSTGLPCARGPTPHWRLVPFDNNLGQRDVAPITAPAL